MLAVKTALVIVLLAAASLFAQDAQIAIKPKLKLDCSKFDDSRGCRSYNEMVEKEDYDIIASINALYHSFVCFRPDEDVFIIFYFPSLTLDYRAVPPNKLIVVAKGHVYYARYKDGLLEYGDVAHGEWVRPNYGPTEDPPPGVFHTARSTQPTALVSDNEIVYGSSFKNLEKSETNYSITIRRSTLRFVETFQAPGHKPSDPFYKSTTGGHCAEFK
jgi:hypothetical protein